MKSEIITQLGQTDILLPSLIADGLSANSRVKARLSVLQAAARHARDPSGTGFHLADECRSTPTCAWPGPWRTEIAMEQAFSPPLGRLPPPRSGQRDRNHRMSSGGPMLRTDAPVPASLAMLAAMRRASSRINSLVGCGSRYRTDLR